MCPMQSIIGTRLRELREKKNLKQEQVAELRISLILEDSSSDSSFYPTGRRQEDSTPSINDYLMPDNG